MEATKPLLPSRLSRSFRNLLPTFRLQLVCPDLAALPSSSLCKGIDEVYFKAGLLLARDNIHNECGQFIGITGPLEFFRMSIGLTYLRLVTHQAQISKCRPTSISKKLREPCTFIKTA